MSIMAAKWKKLGSLMLLYDREKGKDPCDYKMADGKPEF